MISNPLKKFPKNNAKLVVNKKAPGKCNFYFNNFVQTFAVFNFLGLLFAFFCNGFRTRHRIFRHIKFLQNLESDTDETKNYFTNVS